MSTKQLKKDPSLSDWEIFQKLPKMEYFATNFGSFRRFLGQVTSDFYFVLLRWNFGLNALLLSTKKPTFRTTRIVTYKVPSNIFTPLGLALPELESIIFYVFSLYFFLTRKNTVTYYFFKFAPIRGPIRLSFLTFDLFSRIIFYKLRNKHRNIKITFLFKY